VGHVEVAGVSYRLPDGRPLLEDVAFRVGEGATVALVGANGAGKTTLLRIVAGDAAPQAGAVITSGGLGVMRQFIGSVRDESTVRDLLLSVAAPGVRDAGAALAAAERAMGGDERSQLRYAQALADWGELGGYDAEVLWDTCTTSALGLPLEEVAPRPIRTLSGGEQKRLVLEALLRGPDQVLLLDEPDNYLDVPGKLWLEEQLRATTKTVLYVSHDRELLANTATHVVTVEGGSAWVHGGGFASYHDARQARHDRLDELRRRWDEEHAKLRALMLMYKQKAAYNDSMASRYQASVTRLRKFEEAGPPPVKPPEQRVRVRLGGGRTGLRAVTCVGLALTDLTAPFDLEVFYAERVAILGGNGSGKSHFLRLLAGLFEAPGPTVGAPPAAGFQEQPGTAVGRPVRYSGTARLGARVVPGHFAQTHDRPDLNGRTLLEILWEDCALDPHMAAKALSRYELAPAREQRFDTLSGGQQARLQILLLELSGATILLLDEPTDNLDVASAEALEEGLAAYQGTVIAVTHDRWFARSFDRYVVFRGDGTVSESDAPVWDERRVDHASGGARRVRG
jgi:ATPase subunit of ABC transporter with duplicated ATPase domains